MSTNLKVNEAVSSSLSPTRPDQRAEAGTIGAIDHWIAVDQPMRARHAIVIIAIAILAVGAQLFVFPPKNAAVPQAGLDIHQMHKDKSNIPIQEMTDRSLVFDHNK